MTGLQNETCFVWVILQESKTPAKNPEKRGGGKGKVKQELKKIRKIHDEEKCPKLSRALRKHRRIF